MKKQIKGILLCLLIGVSATIAAKRLPLGAVTISLLLGIIITNIHRLSKSMKSGISFTEKKGLSFAIALTGFSLDYTMLANLGIGTIFLIMGGVIFTISFSILLNKVFKLDKDLALLIGVGNAVCGSSAIAAAQGVIKTKEENVGLSIAIINLLGTIGIFLLPFIAGNISSFSGYQKGIYIGNTLQAIGQVSAAGFVMGTEVGKTAVLVKLGRILMITPVVLILGLFKKDSGSRDGVAVKKINIPSYIILFVIFSFVVSLGVVPADIISYISRISKFFLTIAMAAIGMKIRLADIKIAGGKALGLGIVCFFCQLIFSFLILHFFF